MQNNEANTVAKAICAHLILKFGCPKNIRADLGTEYKNSVMKELCERMQINHVFFPPHIIIKHLVQLKVVIVRSMNIEVHFSVNINGMFYGNNCVLL